MAETVSPGRQCRTCTQPRPEDAFYNGCSECKSCKRSRSKRNRAIQARKIAAFERFVDVLFVMANKTNLAEPEEMAS